MYPQNAHQNSNAGGRFTSNLGGFVDHIEEGKDQFIIYALYHPNATSMYIGKSANGLRRPNEHSFPSSLARYAHLPRSKWIKYLHKRGLEPKIAVLEVCANPADSLDEAERFHIAYFKSIGAKLLNLTDGGDGIYGYRHSDKAREKMSKRNKARTSTEEGRKVMSEISKNYWANDEARNKKRAERVGQTWDVETKAKISASHKGRKKTPEERANMSRAAKLRCLDPVWKEKQRQAQIVAQRRPEVRLKKSEASKKAWTTDEYWDRNMAGRKRRGDA